MCDEFKSALVKYLIDAKLYTGDDCVWDIVEKEIYGRCLIAKRDIQANEVIFYDKPLFCGPRVNNYNKIFCVVCYKILPKLTLCNAKCKFPLCDDCQDTEKHRVECELIRSWKIRNENKYSKHLFRALTVIRGLLLSNEDSKLMNMMACHENSDIQNIEVEKILDEFEALTADSEEVSRLKRISSILNTNAFELGLPHDSQPEHGISLRGLFVLGACMNHNCIPNMYYTYNDKKIMTAKASKLIRKGEQIFNTYSKALWGTQQRRVHLGYSKNFLCKCDRCLDRTEMGSYISAIKCINPECIGVMLPINSLVITSPWKCEKCNMKLNHIRVSKLTDLVARQILKRIETEPTYVINQYLKEKVSTFLPSTNQFSIELKLQVILKLKQDPNYVMNMEDYKDIEKYCYDVLEIIDRLSLGENFLKGILYHEIVVAKTKLAELQGLTLDDETRNYMAELLEKSFNILANSISEPKDLRQLMLFYKKAN
ncbi:hypothetical protein PVAND_009914 [Polypedilum vanderplanki]|uniref:SET domain-containing protein n=1 Tax=Polypedilum vanderplanki TaxID=319348 RepID=A0A9J6CEP9_POLVA|nr:hypothetical protein PVAND_009914 [Polypedilum vanderplanki]